MDGLEDAKWLTYRSWPIEEEPEKWVINDGKDDMNCVCGEAQAMSHLLNCKDCPTENDTTDLQPTNNNAINIVEYWRNEK